MNHKQGCEALGSAEYPTGPCTCGALLDEIERQRETHYKESSAGEVEGTQEQTSQRSVAPSQEEQSSGRPIPRAAGCACFAAADKCRTWAATLGKSEEAQWARSAAISCAEMVERTPCQFCAEPEPPRHAGPCKCLEAAKLIFDRLEKELGSNHAHVLHLGDALINAARQCSADAELRRLAETSRLLQEIESVEVVYTNQWRVSGWRTGTKTGMAIKETATHPTNLGIAVRECHDKLRKDHG